MGEVEFINVRTCVWKNVWINVRWREEARARRWAGYPRFELMIFARFSRPPKPGDANAVSRYNIPVCEQAISVRAVFEEATAFGLSFRSGAGAERLSRAGEQRRSLWKLMGNKTTPGLAELVEAGGGVRLTFEPHAEGSP
jgi:hypothetical protein